jgi:heme ABC exporter ATP-binding subunit CcmA
VDPVIHLRGVVSVLGRFPALAGADLDVARGEIVLLIGPNGAGKTSLLRVCAGLMPVASGRVVVLGHELPDERRALRRRVGWLGHANGLYDDLTVVENVRFWARAAGAPMADVEAALNRLEIQPRLWNVEAGRLSAGQRRRAAVAAMVVRRPELWLLDEPHAGLDAQARDDFDELVREAVAGGATAVLASHEIERGGALATRTVQVSGGVVVADGLGSSPSSAGHEHPPAVDQPPAQERVQDNHERVQHNVEGLHGVA